MDVCQTNERIIRLHRLWIEDVGSISCDLPAPYSIGHRALIN
jgi:hypothetical protein